MAYLGSLTHKERAMAHRWKNDLTHADVTPEAVYLNRRQIIAGMAAAGLGSIAGSTAMADDDLKPNTWEEITNYCNYYEFGTARMTPAKHAHRLTTEPWRSRSTAWWIGPGTYGLDEIMAEMTVEERIYRLRCVEAWSMVIPWNGFELADLLALVGVQEARYVAFETVLRPDEMPGVRYPGHRLALCRGAAPRRGDASAHHHGHRGL
jgi:sulfoxide reductase catalytic subunit YedY